jgi:hypothetical protein
MDNKHVKQLFDNNTDVLKIFKSVCKDNQCHNEKTFRLDTHLHLERKKVGYLLLYYIN